MLTDQHPITPPPELVRELVREWNEAVIGTRFPPYGYSEYIATQAARWGADQELEACCEWLSVPCPSYGRELRAARRPKPPSLAEQALTVLEQTMVLLMPVTGPEKIKQFEAIRTALERLQELESNG